MAKLTIEEAQNFLNDLNEVCLSHGILIRKARYDSGIVIEKSKEALIFKITDVSEYVVRISTD